VAAAKNLAPSSVSRSVSYDSGRIGGECSAEPDAEPELDLREAAPARAAPTTAPRMKDPITLTVNVPHGNSVS